MATLDGMRESVPISAQRAIGKKKLKRINYSQLDKDTVDNLPDKNKKSVDNHVHNFIVIDWMEYYDVDRTFMKLTGYYPTSYTVHRSRALELMCSTCGFIKPLDANNNPHIPKG